MITYATITDEISGDCVTAQADEVAAAIGGWFPEAPAEVLEQVDALEQQIRTRAPLAAADYLAVTVELTTEPR